MKKYVFPKLAGLVILTMITLIVLSIIEVAIYSYLVNPGQQEAVYEAHAQSSAPYISGIFGFIIFFMVSRYWKKKGFHNALKLALLYPAVYVTLDLVIIIAAQVDLSTFIFIFIPANIAKFIGSYLGYRLTSNAAAGPAPGLT